ncbi:MAG TPA: oligosaccharide flippase family protein, partial [Solirubrobacteraceae bacterium]
MRGYLKRLVATGAAYQFGDIVAKGIALVTIPLYTRHVSPAGYGAANSLLTAVILASIFLRVGVGEAFILFYFDDDDVGRRERIARTATATVAWTTSLAAVLALVFAAPLSRLLLGFDDALLLDCAIVGLWAFTNLEMAYAQLRVDERARAYIVASGANVGLTVLFTVLLVVVAGQGARGLLLGNFGASALVVLGLWWVLRRRFSLRVRFADLRAMLRFGLPTVPADASVYALQVADRFYVYRGYSHAAAGEYSVALQFATVVFVIVRGFQYAWPPLAYSIASDADASRLYSLVTTYFVLATGVVVAAVALLGRWIVRLLAAPQYFGAHTALPWLALAWTLYGLYQVMIVITGRARATARNLPAAAAGLLVNVALLLALVPRGGAGLGIAGAGIALCGAYVAMLLVMHLLTRRLFAVAFQWRRLAQATAVLAGVAVSGELLLPTSGFDGIALRALWLCLAPALLMLTRFFDADERAQARALIADGRRR